jgi:hypothetical protein
VFRVYKFRVSPSRRLHRISLADGPAQRPQNQSIQSAGLTGAQSVFQIHPFGLNKRLYCKNPFHREDRRESEEILEGLEVSHEES